jgi:hypothetical protein
MSDNVIQASFAAGELSSSLFARVDIAKYRSGAATMRNFFVDYRSGSSTRSGTEFIRPSRYVNGTIRLIRFQQSVDVTYVLEFGEGYLRFTSNGSSVVEDVLFVDTLTNSSPIFLVAVGAGLQDGDTIFIFGAEGMPQINNRYFNITGTVGDTYNLLDTLGSLYWWRDVPEGLHYSYPISS